ncbi:MAG TPA: hypothetical protein VGF74_02360 [Thermoleophilaceae bacterium]
MVVVLAPPLAAVDALVLLLLLLLLPHAETTIDRPTAITSRARIDRVLREPE